MNCEHYSEDWATCTNADCPYCADYCPVSENPEVCRYSGLDDTEMMLRERLDEAVKWREDDLHEFTKKVDVLQKKIKRLKKQIVEVTEERDRAVKDLYRIKSCKICKHCDSLKTLLPEICKMCQHGDKFEWSNWKEKQAWNV